MKDPERFGSRVGSCAVAVVSSLMLAAAARAQDVPSSQGTAKAPPRTTMSRQLPRPAARAGLGTHVLSINGDSFLPVDSVTGWGVRAQVHEQLARLAKALAAPKRIELLDVLAQGPRTVDRLARQTGLSTANASQHLKVLRAARLVEAKKSGLFVTYRLAAPPVGAFLAQLRRLGEAQLSELRVARSELLAAAGGVESIDRATLIRRLRAGDAVLVDVRPREEYEAGHLPGAVSVPLSELRRRIRELPRGCEVVAYCRGPYCMLSIDAARILAARGRRVRRLEDGVAEWRAAGLRVVEQREGLSTSARRS